MEQVLNAETFTGINTMLSYNYMHCRHTMLLALTCSPQEAMKASPQPGWDCNTVTGKAMIDPPPFMKRILPPSPILGLPKMTPGLSPEGPYYGGRSGYHLALPMDFVFAR